MNYFSMNEVPIGTKVKIKDSNLIGEIIEVFHFPTTFKIQFKDGSYNIHKTHEVQILEESSNIEESDE